MLDQTTIKGGWLLGFGQNSHTKGGWSFGLNPKWSYMCVYECTSHSSGCITIFQRDMEPPLGTSCGLPNCFWNYIDEIFSTILVVLKIEFWFVLDDLFFLSFFLSPQSIRLYDLCLRYVCIKWGKVHGVT